MRTWNDGLWLTVMTCSLHFPSHRPPTGLYVNQLEPWFSCASDYDSFIISSNPLELSIIYSHHCSLSPPLSPRNFTCLSLYYEFILDHFIFLSWPETIKSSLPLSLLFLIFSPLLPDLDLKLMSPLHFPSVSNNTRNDCGTLVYNLRTASTGSHWLHYTVEPMAEDKFKQAKHSSNCLYAPCVLFCW